MAPSARLALWARGMAIEQGTLLASLAKWTVLASLAGALAGASTALFLTVLGWAIAKASTTAWSLLLLPPGFVLAYLIVHVVAPEAEGHGTDKVIEAVHRRWGHIPLLVAPVKLVATVVTIATGGSVGKEGPAAQIGAALASGLGSLLALRRADHRKLVVCGIGAGFAAVFGTPIAGAIFGVEVLVMGSLFYGVLYPSFIAGTVSYLVARQLGTVYFHENLATIPAVTRVGLLKVVLAGIVLGFVALLLIETMHACASLARRVPGPRWLIAGGGGALLVLLTAASSSRYLGLGLDTLEDAVRGVAVPPEAFVLKIVFTAISLAVGGSGGIITPVFFIGATAGSVVGGLLGFDRGLFAALGMISLLAAAANAPIAAAVMAIELFGASIGPYAALTAIVSFLMVGHRSVYGSQLLGVAKSASLVAPAGVELSSLTSLAIRRRVSRRRALLRALRRRLVRREPAGR
jgi:chloride channel protein, CIC family